MTARTSRPETVSFDNTDPELITHLYERINDVQSRCPVAWSDASTGFWMLTKYEDVVEASRDWETYTVTEGIMIPPTGASMPVIPAELDPPRHSKLRKLVLPNFTEKALEPWVPGIRRIIADAFEPLLPAGKADIVVDVARPVPVLAICLILGIDTDWRRIRRLAEEFLAATGKPELARAKAAELEAFLEEEIEARRGEPVKDLLGAYVNAEIDGELIPERELLGLVQLLVVAGHETTVNGMGMLLYRLVSEPGLRDRVLADRSLVDKVIDETLRLHPPVWNMGRTVREQTTLRGSTLCPGEKVMLVYGGANRDPDKFEHPGEFDIDRPGITQHLTFGSGRHRCIGEALARLELRLTLNYVLDTIPDVELDGEPSFSGGTNQFGPRAMPVRFASVT
ncbi:MAG: putative cytochrome yjiB [Pseudonocardiales bacterium]|nr:putative cytochrome yjiB [Pseudonocardiales bacterium]